MAVLDTNMLVRWLVADDDAQTAQVQTLFEAAQARRASFFVPSTVLLELEWVLRSRYRLDKAQGFVAFNALLESQELELQGEAGLERALHLYLQGSAEFADCLHAGLCGASNKVPLLTFDVKTARLESLLCHGALATKQIPSGTTPLHTAAIGGDQRAIDLLCKAGGSITALNKDERAPFHNCGITDIAKTVVALIQQCAPVDSADAAGCQPSLKYA